jgi:hypothetical protein
VAESLLMASADTFTAWGTWVIGVGSIGAFGFAARTYLAQAQQLALARADSRRARTPVLTGSLDIWQPGGHQFMLKVRLLSPEAVSSIKITIASPNKCPIGFMTGQDGVESWVDQDSLPAGWKNATARLEAAHDSALMPGAYAQWVMEYRQASFRPGEVSGELSLRAEGQLASADPWAIAVPVEVSNLARKLLAAAS